MSLSFLAYQTILLGVAVLLAQSLNLVWRGNMMSLGHYGFFGIGAYTVAALLRIGLGPSIHWELVGARARLLGLAVLLATTAAAALAAGAIAYVLGRALVRLADDYFAVATLLFGELVWLSAATWPLVGGALGIELPYLVFDGSAAELSYAQGLFFLLLLVLNVGLYLWIRATLDRSLFGLAVAAISDDHLAARAVGVDVERVQRQVFTFGAGVAGAAGGLFAHFSGVLVPSDFRFVNSLPILLYVVLGGLRVRGCVVATVLVYALYELLRLQLFGILGPAWGEALLNWKDAIFGGALILIVLVRAWWWTDGRTAWFGGSWLPPSVATR